MRLTMQPDVGVITLRPVRPAPPLYRQDYHAGSQEDTGGLEETQALDGRLQAAPKHGVCGRCLQPHARVRCRLKGQKLRCSGAVLHHSIYTYLIVTVLLMRCIAYMPLQRFFLVGNE
jgi:hypothetical protein